MNAEGKEIKFVREQKNNFWTVFHLLQENAFTELLITTRAQIIFCDHSIMYVQ